MHVVGAASMVVHRPQAIACLGAGDDSLGTSTETAQLQLHKSAS